MLFGHPFTLFMKWSKNLFKWHHWCGLIVGLFLLLMSLTGSLLVFSEEWESLEQMPAIKVQPGSASFDASFSKVQQQFPDWEIRMYHLPQAEETLVYELRQKEKSQKVYVHPVTGEVVGINENANASFQRSLLLLHYTLFAGTKGKITVFLIGVLFLITLITGLVIYRQALLKTLLFKVRLNRHTTRSFYSSLHRLVGVWSLLFNLLMVTTGLWISGQIALTAIKSPKGPAKVLAAAPVNSIDAIVKKLAKEQPQFEIHLIRIRPGSNVVGVTGRLLNDPKVYGNYYSGFTFDGATTEMLSSYFMQQMPFSQRLAKMAVPLHFGNYGGLPLKIFYCLLGLTPALLSISGFVLWRKRGRKKTVVLKQKRVLQKMEKE